MKKKYIIFIIVLLTIGFASVTTTLIINGKTNIGIDYDDFNVIFVEALLDGSESSNVSISENKKTITFATEKLININDTARLDYKVKNISTQYNGDVTINCTNMENEYFEVTSKFDGKSIPLISPININASEVKSGYLEVKLIKSVTEDKSLEIICTINVGATSRDNYAYTASFNSSGGSEIEDKIVVLNENYGELPTPTKEGYNFKGWYTEDGEKIDSSSIVKIKNNHILIAKWSPICPYTPGKVWEFNYTGGVQPFDVECYGTYQLEVYGGQGTGGGFGGYSSGQLTIAKESTYYVVVGGGGWYGWDFDRNGHYNGGGWGGANTSGDPQQTDGFGGGGATHIATENRGVLKNYSSYRDEVLIVAGGGGGWTTNVGSGGAGGGTSGGGGSFGVGSNGSAHNSLPSGGGGGGWIGGGTYGPGTISSGGKGYISPSLSNTSSKNGVRSGNGYAKITLLSLE